LELTHQALPIREGPLAVQIVRILVRAVHKTREGRVDELLPVDPQQHRQGLVGFQDDTFAAERAVPGRGKVVEIRIEVASVLQLQLNPAQFLVLDR